MNIAERIEAALRSSPSFPFVATCEVARENVLADATDSLVSLSVDYDLAREYGGVWGYWYTAAQYQLHRILHQRSLS